jgi:hypothetical protein
LGDLLIEFRLSSQQPTDSAAHLTTTSPDIATVSLFRVSDHAALKPHLLARVTSSAQLNDLLSKHLTLNGFLLRKAAAGCEQDQN